MDRPRTAYACSGELAIAYQVHGPGDHDLLLNPVLVSSLDGARSLALLAATHPERVGGLIAFSPSGGGAASSAELADSAAQALAQLPAGPISTLGSADLAVRGDRERTARFGCACLGLPRS